MSDDLAVQLVGVGKRYKLFSSRVNYMLDSLGLGRLPGRKVDYREFWALRGIDLELRAGQRIGVIGRNGAGKTTLLKLIAGNVAPTEGTISVSGQVQALLDTGAGFHPDFTGYENIRAALTYQGLSSTEITEAEAEIAEFTELGEFLAQPFKTYSGGMQARLAFATATTIRPEILIVDEILGAGDAYFISKSNERMQSLVHSGAAILLVSHSMLQITQLCDSALWIERGEIVAAGGSIEIVKAYEQFIRKLDDRRLRGRNVKRRALATSTASPELESLAQDVQLRFILEGATGSRFDLRRVSLLSGGASVEKLRVGSPQDVRSAHSAFVVLEGSDWSGPEDDPDGHHRRLVRSNSTDVAGSVSFDLLLGDESDWEVEVEYRAFEGAEVRVEARVGDGVVHGLGSLPFATEWRAARLPLAVARGISSSSDLGADREGADRPAGGRASASGDEITHWPGEGSIIVSRVDLLDRSGQPCAVFEVDSGLTVRIEFRAAVTETYELLPVINVYGLDGTNISTQIGDWLSRPFEAGRAYAISATLEPLNLGNGNYLVSIAMYKSFDPQLSEPPVAYDWVDRSVEFQVVGSPPAITSVFLHPSTWDIDDEPSEADQPRR